MTLKNDIASLKGEILKALGHIDRIHAYYLQFRRDYPENVTNDRNYDLVILADIIADFYTCLETAFVRISKFFENSLDQDKWHRHLLEKMVLVIPGIRDAVLRDETYHLLDEFLRFRHFKRYYYDFDYDRDRMCFLEKKLNQSILLVKADLESFLEFLDRLDLDR